MNRAYVSVTPLPNRAFQPIRHIPQSGPSYSRGAGSDDDDDDEAVYIDDPLIQLQTEYVKQKMEIGDLKKQKLQLTIQLARNAGRQGENPGNNDVPRVRDVSSVTRPTATISTVTRPTFTRPTATIPTVTRPTVTRPTVTPVNRPASAPGQRIVAVEGHPQHFL